MTQNDNIKPAFNTKNIPIIFSSDNNYCPYLGTAIKSIIDNSSKENNYDVIVLYQDISKENQKKILSLAKEHKNFSTRFISIKQFIKNKKNLYTNSYYSTAIYYRFFIEKVCQNYQKVIYLDCDIVTTNDIASLLKINLKNKLLGVNTIPKNLKDAKFIKYINNVLKIPDETKYFNSGVLLISIPNITKFKLLEKTMINLKEIKKPIFPDQDILNSVCFNKVKFIDKKYNYYPVFYKNNNKKIIIHYIINKPWQRPNMPLGEIFWKYAKLTPFYEEIIYKNITNIFQDKTNNILNSKSWKLTKPFRFIFNNVRKIKQSLMQK